MPNTGKQVMPSSRGGQRSRGRRLNFKQVKQVTRLINKNKRIKQRFITQNDLLQDAPGSLQELTTVQKGTTFSQSDSDKIAALSLQVHLSINVGEGDNAADDVLRYSIVRSKTGTLTSADMPSILGPHNLDLYQVYLDKYITMREENTIPIEIDYYKSFKTNKVPHMVIGYDAADQVINAVNNPIYLWYIKQSASVTNGAIHNGYSLMKFADLD